MMKSKFYLVGGNGEVVQNKVLPDVTDDEIEKLYKDMIKDDPDHAKFKGSKREYVKKLYDRMKLFMDIQDAFFNEKKKRKMKGGMLTDVEGAEHLKTVEASEEETKELELERTKLLDVLERYEGIDDPTDLYKIIYDDKQPTKYTSTKPVETLREIIKSEIITYSSIERVKKRFRIFANSFLKAIENNTLPSAKKIKRNILNLLMFPYISDWNHYGGLGTYQLRTFAGRGQDQVYITNIQSKYGEYLIKSDKDWMESMGFKQDMYREGTFLLRSCDLFESDIFDLQQIENTTIYRIGEVKTFFTGKPLQLQKTKLTIMAKVYDWITNVPAAGSGDLSINGYNFKRLNFTMKKNIPVILFYIDQTKSRTNIQLDTTEVIPIRIEFNGFKIIEYFKEKYEDIYDQMISVDLNKYFNINDKLRITRPSGKDELLPDVSDVFNFNVTDLVDARKQIIKTSDNTIVLLPDTPVEATAPFPHFSKIPTEGFTTYNYRLPPQERSDASSKNPYGLLKNQMDILNRCADGSIEMTAKSGGPTTNTWVEIGRLRKGITAVSTTLSIQNTINDKLRKDGKQEIKIFNIETEQPILNTFKRVYDLPLDKTFRKTGTNFREDTVKDIYKEWLQVISKLILNLKAEKIKPFTRWLKKNYRYDEKTQRLEKK